MAEPVFPQSSLRAVKSFVQVTPAQISEAAPVPPWEANQSANSVPLPLPSHSTVRSEAATSILGGVVSSIVKVAVVVLELLHSSVAVKVTVAEPVAPQSSESPLKSLLQVTPEHASEAVAPPLFANQSFNSVVLPVPSHSTVSSEASVMAGAVVSSMVKVAVVDELLPDGSVTVKITVAEPVAPQSSLKAVKSLDQTIPQASEAWAPPLDANQLLRSVVFPVPSHSTVRSDASVVMLGAI